MKKLYVHLALISVSFLYGVAYIINKYVLQFIPASALILCRTIGATVILYLIVRHELARKKPTGRQWRSILVLSIFGVVLNLIGFMEGLARTTATHAAVINCTVPLFTLLFSVLLGQEKLNRWRTTGMLICLTGILVILEVEKQRWGNDLFIGDLLCVFNSMCFAFYLALSQRINKAVSPMVITTGMFFFGSVFLSFYGGFDVLNAPWGKFPPLVFAAICYLIVGSTVITYFLNNWALTRVESSAVGIYIFLQPVLAGYLAHLVFGERLTQRTILASLLVFAGVIIGNLLPFKRKKREIYVEPHVS